MQAKMKKFLNLETIITWAAWLVFLTSLFLPMENHNVPGPCAEPCVYPPSYTVLNNSIVFLFTPFLLILYLIQFLLTWDGFEQIGLFTLYLFIGLGEILLFLAPFLVKKINTLFLRRSHLAVTFISTTAILLYRVLPNVRFGIDPLRIGYYVLVSSFLLALLASLLRLNSERQ
jgi:hypothetical protein